MGLPKRIFGFATLCAAAFAVYEYGPAAWGAWQFKRALDAQVRSFAAKNPRVAELAQTCGLCHGAAGNGLSDSYPKLAGQPAAYLVAQLNDFADGRRLAPQMQPLAMKLTAEERQLISAYYAALPAGRLPRGPSGAANLAPCAACHGPSLEGGVPPILAPRLAGQGYLYLVRQLAAFKTGLRPDPAGTMASVTRDLDQPQIEALAASIAAYQPPAQATTAESR